MIVKKYHVATGDGKGYYGIGYESYRQAESLLKISQEHDPEAHIVEEEYHITNADRIRAMSDEELAEIISKIAFDIYNCNESRTEYIELLKTRNKCDDRCGNCVLKWLKQPAE